MQPIDQGMVGGDKSLEGERLIILDCSIIFWVYADNTVLYF